MREQATLSRRALAAANPFAIAAPTMVAASASDPVFAQIELHKALRIRANTVPGSDKDPVYQAAQAEEEAAIQALGNMMPISLPGAVAQLRYMAEVEGDFADDGSPLLRTVLSVAAGLSDLQGSASA